MFQIIGKWYAQGLSIWRSMNTQFNAANKALERIATGYRINRAADDPAGLAISEKMRAQISGLNQAGKNIQNGMSMLQTAEGALNETHAILQRMRDLAVQSASDTLTDDDRALIQTEYEELKKEIQRISKDTQFNQKNLINGDYKDQPFKIQAGANAGQTIDLYLGDASLSGMGLPDTSSIGTREDAEKAISEVDDAINQVSKQRSKLGAYMNRLEHAYNVTMNTHENLVSAESRIRDADIAKEDRKSVV